MGPRASCYENEKLRKTASQGLVCLSLVDDLGVFSNMFLRFAVAFLEHSENLRLIRGKTKRAPENKKHQSETVYVIIYSKWAFDLYRYIIRACSLATHDVLQYWNWDR